MEIIWRERKEEKMGARRVRPGVLVELGLKAHSQDWLCHDDWLRHELAGPPLSGCAAGPERFLVRGLE